MRKLSLLVVLAMVSGVVFAQAPGKKTLYTYVSGLGNFDAPNLKGAAHVNDSTAEWGIGYVQSFAKHPRIIMGAEFYFEAGLSPDKVSTLATSGLFGTGNGNVAVPLSMRAKLYTSLYGFSVFIDTRFFAGVAYTWGKGWGNHSIFVSAGVDLNFLGKGYTFLDDLQVTFGYNYNLPKGFNIGTDLGIHFGGISQNDMIFAFRWNVVNVGWTYEAFSLSATFRLEPRIGVVNSGVGDRFRLGTYGSFRYNFDLK